MENVQRAQADADSLHSFHNLLVAAQAKAAWLMIEPTRSMSLTSMLQDVHEYCSIQSDFTATRSSRAKSEK